MVYDLQFALLTESGEIDLNRWLDDYIERRYGAYSDTLRKAWDILLSTCYRDSGYKGKRSRLYALRTLDRVLIRKKQGLATTRSCFTIRSSLIKPCRCFCP